MGSKKWMMLGLGANKRKVDMEKVKRPKSLSLPCPPPPPPSPVVSVCAFGKEGVSNVVFFDDLCTCLSTQDEDSYYTPCFAFTPVVKPVAQTPTQAVPPPIPPKRGTPDGHDRSLRMQMQDNIKFLLLLLVCYGLLLLGCVLVLAYLWFKHGGCECAASSHSVEQSPVFYCTKTEGAY